MSGIPGNAIGLRPNPHQSYDEAMLDPRVPKAATPRWLQNTLNIPVNAGAMVSNALIDGYRAGVDLMHHPINAPASNIGQKTMEFAGAAGLASGPFQGVAGPMLGASIKQASTLPLVNKFLAALKGTNPDNVKIPFRFSEDHLGNLKLNVGARDGDIITTGGMKGFDASTTRYVDESHLPRHLRGTGTGDAMYETWVDDAFDKGLHVASDSRLSAGSRQKYERLKERGYDVRQNPNVREVVGRGGKLGLDSTDGQHVFRVAKPGTSGTHFFSDTKQASPVAIFTAYHGSPHDFDKFSMDHIGTGEGAQRYGHGLYFSEVEDVAKSYRENLTQGANEIGQEWIDQYGSQKAALAALDKEFAAGNVSGGMVDSIRTSIKNGGNPGHMYEVQINANKDDFLDYDKPLSEQSEAVKQRISDWHGDEYTKSSVLTGANMAPGPGGDLKAYVERGIPGIRYLDQQSRGAGQGSSNYVLFDPDLIDIKRKYAQMGIPLPPELGGYVPNEGETP